MGRSISCAHILATDASWDSFSLVDASARLFVVNPKFKMSLRFLSTFPVLVDFTVVPQLTLIAKIGKPLHLIVALVVSIRIANL
ncbi:hypothetical protein M407DRAFT_138908 [Tulasnella calospora MUT 4182]|uniref:Uncharacterized protein n=1 Tax=Tulasnella calospora MUT 4182 TaxID=1051891 RepID=A0A0C3LBC3_9AGAM|nr:hypothetical protein M407DRAFT_138908 [Tulasnella calospora MUT 4182]